MVGLEGGPQNDHVDYTILIRRASGKSSLIAAICNLLELKAGSIYVDGVDIRAIPNSALSSHILVVPQDAFLSTGTTIRFNVFASAMCSDSTIVEAFQRVGLWDIISKAGGLDADISAVPLSHGQKQLFRLACALVHGSRIIILDEATSSMDSDTERMIHKVIEEEFHNRTMLIIAHRPNTLLHCDRVLTMDGGRIVNSSEMHPLLRHHSHQEREL